MFINYCNVNEKGMDPNEILVIRGIVKNTGKVRFHYSIKYSQRSKIQEMILYGMGFKCHKNIGYSICPLLNLTNRPVMKYIESINCAQNKKKDMVNSQEKRNKEREKERGYVTGSN